MIPVALIARALRTAVVRRLRMLRKRWSPLCQSCEGFGAASVADLHPCAVCDGTGESAWVQEFIRSNAHRPSFQKLIMQRAERHARRWP